jgi:membrane associated rhomboid family serine protease
VTEPLAETTCYRHPDRPTGLRCTECGRPICSECSIDAAVGQRCPTCVARGGAQQTVNVRSNWASTVRRGAPLTSGIIGVSVAIYLVSFLSPTVYTELFRWFVMSNALVGAGELWRLFTVVLLHASITHILFNMWALYNLGPQIEREVGTARFLALYLSTAAVGSAFAFHFGAKGTFVGGPGDLAVGASGAIFGLFGVWMASAVRRRHTRVGRAILNQLGFLLVINAAIPFFVPQVSWQAHLGGLIGGFVIGWVWGAIRGRNASQIHLAFAVTLGALAVLSIPVLG